MNEVLPEYKAKAGAIAEQLQEELRSVLGAEFKVTVTVLGLAGGINTSLIVALYGANPVNGIAHNSPTHTHIWMHGPFKGMPAWECSYRPKTLRFRKITAATIEEANRKLVTWLTKVRPELVELELEKKQKTMLG